MRHRISAIAIRLIIRTGLLASHDSAPTTIADGASTAWLKYASRFLTIDNV
jgi:hypothetical protein